MKVCFIIPSAEHSNTAGVRIRYDRLAAHNEAADLTISTSSVPELIERKTYDQDDVYVFSKVYTPLAALFTRRMQENGKVVGLDIFDDYFSPIGDVRLQQYRSWLEKYAPKFDFLMCSTKRIQSFLRHKFPGKPILMIPDPGSACDLAAVWSRLNVKLERALQSRELDILWFGIATNPFFPVGVHDLAAYGEELARLRAAGWMPRLTVLTNLASLEVRHLTRLARLPVSYELQPWSVEEERRLLDKAFICFLPVNGQEFSRAKSLNRAISALSSGCQVLSNGFPLYEDLAGLVYASVDTLIGDLAAGRMKLGAETISAIGQALSSYANPYRGLDDLRRFLLVQLAARPGRGAAEPVARQDRRATRSIDIGILHGSGHDTRTHKAAGMLGALSMKSPFTNANLNFHVRFDSGTRGEAIVIAVRSDALKLVAPEFRDSFEQPDEKEPSKFLRMSPQAVAERFQIKGGSFLQLQTPVGEICGYTDVMASVVAACKRLFPELDIAVAELANLRRFDEAAN